nr:glycosyltransferase family 9 protein [Desulfovibrio sp.]
MGERGSHLKRRLDYFLGIPLVCATALLRLPKSKAWQTLLGRENLRVGFLCFGAIGDLVLLTALIAALRRQLPRAYFCLVTSQANAQVAPLVPGIDEHKAFALWQIPAMIAFLRRSKLDLLFDSSQWARLGSLVSNCSGAGCTVGFASHGQWRSVGYDYVVPHRSDQHEVENFLDLGRVCYPELSGAPSLVLPKAWNAKNALQARAQACPKAIYLHLWPSGIHATLKEWPMAHWAELIDRLTPYGFSVFLTGSEKDHAANDAFLASYPDLGATSLAGALSLTDLAWLFTRASAVIAVNTGTMHLAAVCGAPTVGLHGPTNPRRWGPLGPRVCALLPRTGAM